MASACKIFISYRREDSSYATRFIYERLTARFGADAVFLDHDKTPLGVDFREHLGKALSQCAVLLAIIGDRWLHSREPGKERRRLDNPRDPVAIEIKTALERGIAVIPVLLESASMPTEEELPVGLQDFAFRQAAEVRSGSNFHLHLDRLIRALESFQGLTPVAPFSEPITVSGENHRINYFVSLNSDQEAEEDDPTDPLPIPPDPPIDLEVADRKHLFDALFEQRILLLSADQLVAALDIAHSLIFDYLLADYEKRALFLGRHRLADLTIDFFGCVNQIKKQRIFLVEVETRSNFLDSLLCIGHSQVGLLRERLRERDCFLICLVKSEDLELVTKRTASLPFFHWHCRS